MTWSRLRLRQTPHLRDLTDEIGFTTAHLIQPIFVGTQEERRRPVDALDDNARLNLLELADRGLGHLDEMLLETWHVFRRAGAGFIITYGARRAAALGVSR